MKNILILLLVISFPSYLLVQNMEDNPSGSLIIDVATFSKKSGEINTMVLDVRTREEFDSGHIPNAFNIDFSSAQFDRNVARLDKNKTYLLYCHSGNRSKKVSSALLELGFDKVFDLEGGISEWKKQSRPVSK